MFIILTLKNDKRIRVNFDLVRDYSQIINETGSVICFDEDYYFKVQETPEQLDKMLIDNLSKRG